ncbi:hypothetical protein [Nonomuraea pusilla]|uniref:Uncharacterized protein n=1 Tax=Nonomuraea pusilla TaxID=46177 RepID=A0A1H8K232_9ACTN|nr:hypothetical protein [Nonomuraea pusilla]SEN86616.1 hypothetical protein SAMN05660976_08492 [Nonomuraea pusilla]
MQSIDDILGQMRLPERVYPLCVRPDLQAEWEQAEAELEAAQRSTGDSLAGVSTAVKSAAKKVQQLEAEMAEHTIPITLRALTHKAWSDLVAAHPPREDSEDGSWNAETFGPALLAACAAAPAIDVEKANALVDRMTMGQWNDLQRVLFNLNASGVDVPKSWRASAVLASSKKR